MQFSDAPSRPLLDRTGRGNALWQHEHDLRIGLAALAHTRTIAVIVESRGSIVFTRAGFFDGIEALRQTLTLASEANVDLASATVLTDGCFGIRLPTQTLTSFGVRSFVFGGGKPNDDVILADLADHHIGAFLTGERYFSL